MKKLFAVLLAAVMLISSFSVISFAAETVTPDTVVDTDIADNNNSSAIKDAVSGMLSKYADVDGDGDFDSDDLILIVNKKLEENAEEEANKNAMIQEIVIAVIRVVFSLLEDYFAA